MRRLALAIALALLSLCVTGQVMPAHAQTASPVVTVMPATVATGGTATVSGSGFSPNYYAYVYYQRPDGTSNAFYVSTSSTGTFSFTLGFAASHRTGAEYVSAYDYLTGRWAPFAQVSVTSGAPGTVETLMATSTTVARGGSTVISGSGFTPNQYVYVFWQRPDNTTGATYAYTSSTGTFSFTLGFLVSHGCGTEQVRAYDYGTSTYSSAISLTVTC